MAKYAMLNCWDDQNKGDLGIMLATAQEFMQQDSDAEIIGISSFDENDPAFISSHTILRQYIPQIYPCIFGTLGLFIRGQYKKGIFYKIIAIIQESIRYHLCMLFPNNFAKVFLKKSQRKTLDIILSCDVSFSKGGSVFTDYNTTRGLFALIRLCRLYNLIYKFGGKYFILGQSFGPVKSVIATRAVNRVISNAECVYLRELQCVEKYPRLNLSGRNVSFSNDSGFLIAPKEIDAGFIDKSKTNVGMTIRGLVNDQKYIDSMVRFIEYLALEKKCDIHIFRQVSMNSEPDNVVTDMILEKLFSVCKRAVFFHKENFLPQELCWLYGQMDLFVGTRLHSTIFSMRAGTPALGISYHGTKTQGVYGNLGISELIVSEIGFDILKEKYEYLVTNKEKLEDTIKHGVIKAQNEMKRSITNIINVAKGEN